jgi:hypothetical protein
MGRLLIVALVLGVVLEARTAHADTLDAAAWKDVQAFLVGVGARLDAGDEGFIKQRFALPMKIRLRNYDLESKLTRATLKTAKDILRKKAIFVIPPALLKVVAAAADATAVHTGEEDCSADDEAKMIRYAEGDGAFRLAAGVLSFHFIVHACDIDARETTFKLKRGDAGWQLVGLDDD